MSDSTPAQKFKHQTPPASLPITGHDWGLRWVRLKKYCELTGDTPAAVDSRLRTGHWLRDVHARRPDGSKETWINLPAVNDWAEGVLPAHLHGKRR